MSQRVAIRERRQKRKQQQRLITIMIVAGIALIAVAIIMIPTIMRNLETVGEFTQPEQNPRPLASENTMGDPNAPVVIEEFSDFGCNHCANFVTGTGEQIAQEYVANGQVYFISRSAGNLLNNPNTQLAAEAAYCAADQDMYWEYHDIIYANQSILFYGGLNYIDNYLEAFANALDLDMDQFNTCMDDHLFRQQMLLDGNEARSQGINGTPAFLINGKLIPGNVPYEEFQQAIAEAQAQSNQ